MSFYRWQGKDLVITCYLQPRASKDEFAGLHGDSLKVRIKAPPVEGKANACLVKFLAECFGVPRRNVEIIGGKSSRKKRIRIIAPAVLPDRLGTGTDE